METPYASMVVAAMDPDDAVDLLEHVVSERLIERILQELNTVRQDQTSPAIPDTEDDEPRNDGQ